MTGMCTGTTAHSAYKAPGLSTSSGARFRASPGVDARDLKGVGRKSACNVDCSVEAGDFVRMRRSGLSKIYLVRVPVCQHAFSLESPTEHTNSQYHSAP